MRTRAAFAPLLVGALVAALLAVVDVAGPAGASARGALAFAGCIQHDDSARDKHCKPARALDGTAYLAVTRDGRFVYATARDADSVTVLRRDPASGALTQLPGAAGCWVDGTAGTPGTCSAGVGLDRASGVTLSPDEAYLYVAGRDSDTVAAFRRDPATGTLTQIGCVAGKFSPVLASCTSVPALDEPITMAVTADGSQLLAALGTGNGVLALNRDPAGLLTGGSCVVDTEATAPPGCSEGPGLAGVTAVSVSPDGRNVYAAATGDSAVTTLARDPATGGLAWAACISGDGVVRRDPACQPARGIQFAQNVAVSPDGRNVYVAATDSHVIAIFTRDATTGAIAQLPGLDGCMSDATYGPDYCYDAPGLALPYGLAFAPDGRRLYTGSFGVGELASFSRRPASGRLRFLGCLAEGEVQCAEGEHLGHAGFLAASPDGRHLYANAPDASSVVVVAVGRRVRPVEVSPGAARLHRRTVSVRLICPDRSEGGCTGRVTVAAVIHGLRGKPSKAVRFDLAAGATATMAIGVTAPVARALKRAKGPRVEIAVRTDDQAGRSSVAWWERRLRKG
jgi:6-phosphogluconolactonase (cycloisomerase 2 family)